MPFFEIRPHSHLVPPQPERHLLQPNSTELKYSTKTLQCAHTSIQKETVYLQEELIHGKTLLIFGSNFLSHVQRPRSSLNCYSRGTRTASQIE